MLALSCALGSCEKFLDEKANLNQAIPETLKDLQAILDHYQFMNNNDGSAAEVSSTDVYLTDADLSARTEVERNLYTWQRGNIFLYDGNEWFYNYRAIYRANSVLEFIQKIPQNGLNASEWNNVIGQAYYYRAKNHLKGLYTWANAYDEATSGTELGIPLRLTSDVEAPLVRASVSQGYLQVISDLKKAISALPVSAVHVMRPSKPAAYGLLARTYWSMRKYDMALLYADSCLKLKSDLIDFNTLNAAATFPVPQFNVEVLHDSYFSSSVLNVSRAKIDPQLYALYEPNDLRKSVFFNDNKNGTFGFKASYEGTSNWFSGVSVDEVLLIRAECLARTNKLVEALADVNRLLRSRFKRNTFSDIVLSDQQAVLALVLRERRKQLLMRGLRWVDVKRLNKEGNGIKLSKAYKGVSYDLLPNSKGFTLPIPEKVIELGGIQQNP